LLKARGWVETQNEVANHILTVSVPAVTFFIVLFVINFFRAPSLIHKDQLDIISKKNDEIQHRNTEIEKLKNSISSPVLTPLLAFKTFLDKKINQAKEISKDKNHTLGQIKVWLENTSNGIWGVKGKGVKGTAPFCYLPPIQRHRPVYERIKGPAGQEGVVLCKKTS